MNVTPLIDVVFLLLIFFMVSTTFTRESHLSLDLPEASVEPSEAPPARIEILIDAEGHYRVDERGLADSRIETLIRALNEISGGDSGRPLTITADANTPHQAVVRAMDAAGQLGFAQLSLTTRQATDD